MERQDYPAMLPQLHPSQAVSILDDRVRQVGRLNTAIADWLLARRQVEEQYAAGLRRLAQRSLEAGDLGIFSVPWSTISGSSATMAAAHASFASRIENEIEQPLRLFATKNREMAAMPNIQGNLAALARDVEKAQQKTEKLKGRGEKAEANKVANASSDLDSAQSQWESQAPYVFESLQAADETRINHLRDLLTQFQTMETDQLDRSRQSAEQCLNVLLNVQTEDEIKTFALKTIQGRPSLARAQGSSYNTPSRVPTGGTPAPPSRQEDEGRSQRSGSVQEGAAEEKPSKSRLGGLKRFGTVINKRRESRIPPSATETPEKKSKPSGLGRLGRSRGSSSNLAAVDEGQPPQRPASPARLGSELFQSPSERLNDPLNSVMPEGEIAAAVGAAGAAATVTGGVATTAILQNGSHQNDLADLEPLAPSQPTIQTPQQPASKDDEGFTIPSRDVDPISLAQLEANSAEGSTPPFNLNIRDAPIQQQNADDDAALANVANKLQAPPPTTRRANTLRGRRGDRTSSAVNSAYIADDQGIPEDPPAQASSPSALETAQPTSIHPGQPAAVAAGAAGAAGAAALATTSIAPLSPPSEQISPLRTESRTGLGDNHSIRSAATSASQSASKHPDLSGSGLNSSIIETVGARFENGKLTSATLIGEIALAFNPVDFSSPFGTEAIRLDGFSSLEKVAPNPAFITQVPGKEGEYIVNLGSIAKTQIAFKYQVSLESESSHAPLLIVPAFRIEPNQTSIIVSYSLNPAFSLGAQQSLELSNVVIALTLDGAKATGCQSRPVGAFSREKNLVFWHLNNITLTKGAAPEKLLARFATDGEAKSGSIDAKWEISGEAGLATGSNLGISEQVQAAGDGDDPFADDGATPANSWKSVNGVKKVISGLYVAK